MAEPDGVREIEPDVRSRWRDRGTDQVSTDQVSTEDPRTPFCVVW